jgi:hypothetical protein
VGPVGDAQRTPPQFPLASAAARRGFSCVETGCSASPSAWPCFPPEAGPHAGGVGGLQDPKARLGRTARSGPSRVTSRQGGHSNSEPRLAPSNRRLGVSRQDRVRAHARVACSGTPVPSHTQYRDRVRIECSEPGSPESRGAAVSSPPIRHGGA